MRHFTIALASLCMLLVVSQRTKADMIYDLQNYPADQNGHTLSGTISTDGTIGTLQPSNILSWSVTIDGTDNFSSHDAGASTLLAGLGPSASPTELTFSPSPSAAASLFELSTEPPGGGPVSSLQWLNPPTGIPESPLYAAYYHAGPPATIQSSLWYTNNPIMGGTDPWVLAVAQTTAVPEPSALVLVGSAIVCGLAYGLARKRRAQRKARNE